MSIESLKQLGINNPSAKIAFMAMHFKEIKDQKHFDNCIAYLKRKTVIVDNESLEFKENKRSTLVNRVVSMKNKPKHSPEEMAEFRQEYPRQNSWKKDCVTLRLSKKDYEEFMSLERQRQTEDRVLPIPKSEFKKLAPFVTYLKFLRELRNKIESHSIDTGVALFLAGRAGTYKSTTCEILADSFGPYHVWPGTQFIKEDTLKYDSAARAQIESIVLEECKFVNLLKKITLNDTLCFIKEQLSGSNLHVRLAKNKSAVEDIDLAINRFLISFNPDEYIDFDVLKRAVMAKTEFSRRFLVYDMDSIEYANLFHKTSIPWKKEYRMTAAKIINDTNWSR